MPDLQQLISRVFRSAVAWMFLTTLLRVGGFFLVMGYALRELSSEDMGLWFVLANMTGMACAIELGFNTAISRSASYLMGGAVEIPQLGGIQTASFSGQPNFAGLAGLIEMSRKLYRHFAILVGVVLLFGGGGWLVIVKAGYVHTPSQWITFLLMVGATVVNMASLFWWPLLFGLNRVRQYNQLQVGGLLANYAVAFSGLRLGFGLPVLAVGNFLLNFVPRQASRRAVLKLIPVESFRSPAAVSWRILWPITWRTGLVSLASLLMLSATTLVCAQVFDLKTAASYGLSMQLGLMLHGVSQSWLVVKYPELSTLRARGESLRFNRIVRQRMLLCIGTYIMGAVVLGLLLPYVMGLIRSQTAPLDAIHFSMLLLVIGLDLFVGLHTAVMVTSENATPHLLAYSVTGVGSVVLAFVLGRSYGLGGLIAAPFFAQALFNYWWIPWRCWRGLRTAVSCEAKAGGLC